jgi:hypothetical protein
MAQHVLTYLLLNPKAVALVLGPLGASVEGTMQVFGSPLYSDLECSIVAARCPPSRFFLAQHRFLRPTAAEVLKQTASALRSTPPTTPLVIHLFSNGGAFLLEELELLMEEEENRQELDEKGEEKVSLDDVRLVKSRLQYQFYDSCPCYLHMSWNISPFLFDAFPFPGWSSIGRKVYFLGSACSLTLWCTITASFNRSQTFWNHMRQSPCKNQIFMYTTADMMTDATRIDELIEMRQREQNVDIAVYRYTDSGHCVLHRDHPFEYNQAVADALKGAIARAQEGQRSTSSI